ncbi:MAG: AMP-binding protein [Gammaproteobacteria bacterium]|nr:AMP-binding protein [Gammaproteobacteria bacterium]
MDTSTPPATVFTIFAQTVGRYGARPFLHIPARATRAYAGVAIDYTYEQAMIAIEILRARYRAAGYGLGQRVAIMLDNRAEMFLHFLALNSLGASIVPVNAGFVPAEMAYVIRHSDACLVVALAEYRERVQQALAGAGTAPAIADPALGDLAPARTTPAAGAPGPASEAAMLYTSGTTGRPKGCMLSNFYFVAMGHWYARLGGYCELRAGAERLVTPLPLVHMNALATSTTGMIATGGCIVQLDRFHPSSWWQTVRESAATCLHYLGVMPAMLLSQPRSPADDFSAQLRFGFGAGVDPKHHERFESRFGFPLIEGWAMTETGAAGCIMANREPRHVGTRCFGKAPDTLAYRIVDDTGADRPAGEPGELLVRARGEDPRRGFFSGYYRDPEATAAAWAGGWFHTGDIVRAGDDGSLYFVDRKKNIIRRSGENIAAVEIEGALFQSPLVKNCAVTPVADEIRGEEVMACVILPPGESATRERADAIFGHVLEKLAYYKTPGWIAFVTELPTTVTQKVQRGELKALAQSLIDGGRAFDLRARKKRPRS